tara:strand:+ start:584 stop:712 length:129 start_codon:yes stop_codon:yes gene_type:complete
MNPIPENIQSFYIKYLFEKNQSLLKQIENLKKELILLRPKTT